MRVLVVIDDTSPKSEVISDVIGSKGFSEVVVKRRTLGERLVESIKKCYSDATCITVKSPYEFNDLLKKIVKLSQETRVLHFFSNYIISDEEKCFLTLRKLEFVDTTLAALTDNKIAAVLCPDVSSYESFLSSVINDDGRTAPGSKNKVSHHTIIDGLIDIGKVENFIQCITGNFDARYFNSLHGDEYTLVKSSTNIKKIKAEYTFWHLLPEDMQPWFVEPYNYVEDGTKASYSMERLHMTDLAIKWVHGSIDEEEFSIILDKYFYFFAHRHERQVTKEEYDQIADELYVKKVVSRIDDLKSKPEFKKMANLLDIQGTLNMDEMVNRYFELKKRLEANAHLKSISVIGHGDPCFSNAMYNKSTRTLKFIDPKGALTEEELWTNPYYDIAKLSHSICGRYDFFNNGLFDISIDENFGTVLNIDFDNKKYIKMFHKKLEENGYDYRLVRLYEASLFLSMLPLHIDNPRKVYGFILNANNILKEIEDNV